MLTQERLKELLNYDENTGLFVLKKYRGGKLKEGETCGNVTDKGYIDIKVDGKIYKAHRLAFLYMNGEFPKEVDHINRIRDDNRWSNLRASDRSSNCRNRGPLAHRSLPVGVYAHRNKYKAMVGVNYSRKYLGLFDTPELATEARNKFINQIAEVLEENAE